MALSQTVIDKIVALHGETYLIAVTNPEQATTPTEINETALEVHVESAEAWFSRHGYSITRENTELLAWLDVFCRPRNQWGASERERWKELEAAYPHNVSVGAYTTGVAEGEAGDKRNFGRDQLDELYRGSSRTIRPQPRGDY